MISPLDGIQIFQSDVPPRRQRDYVLEKTGAADGVIKGVMRREVRAEFLDLRCKSQQIKDIRKRMASHVPESNVFSIQHAGIGRKASAGPQGKGYRNDGETYTLDSRGSADAVCKTDAPFGVRAASGLPEGLDSNRWRAIGNAGCVPVIEWIAKRIVKMDQKYYPEHYIKERAGCCSSR